jgi:hypothetical protein
MHIKQFSLFLSLWLSCVFTQAQTGFNLDAIPDSLKKKAAVITHIENINLKVESLDKAVMKVKKVFTVLNEEGKGALLFNEYTSRYVTLDDVEIKVYDKSGKQVGKYKKKDLNTVAIGEGLVEDGYVTYFYINAPSYPVTVEYSYEQKFKSTLSLPDYRFIQPKEAVISSSYLVSVPSDINIRYKARHTNIKPSITEEGKNKIYQWNVKNIPAIENEDGSVAASHRFPHVKITTDQFSHYGYKGDQSSWQSFGKWIDQLAEGLDELPEERQKFFQQLVSDASDENEKIRRVYNYLQENFRYVSIQLGIGGLRPFSASFTDEKKYGDCKALSNYMKAALKAVGIRSHLAVINAAYNEEPVDPDFPSNDFNHMILCVPGPKDSVWLECTSNTAEYGQLGTFTENRNALLITEKGGVLVPTPKSLAEANSIVTHTTVKLDNDLSALTETKIHSKGRYREIISNVLKDNKDDQKTTIVMFFGYKQPDDFEFSTTVPDKESNAVLRMAIRKIPEFNAGTKHFINPRINKIWSSALPVYENRKLDFYFPHPFEKMDTTVLVLPPGFTVDVLPMEKTVKCDYASYKASSWVNEKENAVYTATSLILERHKILAKDYTKVKSFFDEVIQDDSQRLVVKGTIGAPQEKRAF